MPEKRNGQYILLNDDDRDYDEGYDRNNIDFNRKDDDDLYRKRNVNESDVNDLYNRSLIKAAEDRQEDNQERWGRTEKYVRYTTYAIAAIALIALTAVIGAAGGPAFVPFIVATGLVVGAIAAAEIYSKHKQALDKDPDDITPRTKREIRRGLAKEKEREIEDRQAGNLERQDHQQPRYKSSLQPGLGGGSSFEDSLEAIAREQKIIDKQREAIEKREEKIATSIDNAKTRLEELENIAGRGK